MGRIGELFEELVKEVAKEFGRELAKALPATGPSDTRNDETGGLFGVTEAAHYLQMSEHWIYRQVSLGKSIPNPIPVERVGRLLRFRKSELDKWLRGAGRKRSGRVGTDRN